MALEPQQDQLRITDKNSLKQWFKRGLKPLEAHFWAWLDSFWHKNDKLPISSISNLGTTLDTKANVGHIHIEYTTPDAVQQMIDSRVSSLYRLMSPVATYADLPMDGNLNGDVRNVLNTDMNYVWDGSNWDALGGLLDLSNYVNQLQFASALRDMATKTWVNQQLANVSVDLSNYYTAEDVDWRIGQAVLGFATEAWVNEQIGRIVSGGSMDLSIYATNDASSLSDQDVDKWKMKLGIKDLEFEPSRKYRIIEDMYRSPLLYRTNKIFDLAYNYTLIESVYVDGVRLLPNEWSYNYSTRRLNVISLPANYIEMNSILVSVIGEVETDNILNIVDSSRITELVYETTNSNELIHIPISSDNLKFITIDWGDGSFLNSTSHNYESAGRYNIKIKGAITSWGSGNLDSKLKLKEILSWGNLFFNTASMFDGYENLTLNNVNDLPIISRAIFTYMFRHCKSLTTINRINEWNMSGIKSLAYTFQGCINFNQDLSNWDVSSVDTFFACFNGCTNFNGNVRSWNLKVASALASMFVNCVNFNSDLSNWDVSKVTRFDSMFNGASAFNSDLSSWNVDEGVNMSSMFSGCSKFSSDLSSWNVSKVTNMRSMFQGCSKFSSDLSNWDVSNVTTMQSMFNGASAFNSDISNWDVSKVTTMSSMFNGASAFNSDISNWNVSKVTTMAYMFYRANAFNSDLSNWDVSNVTTMQSMFYQANAFNSDISSWNVSKVENFQNFMYGKLAANFSPIILASIYTNWSLISLKSNITISFGSIKFNAIGLDGKNKLIKDFNWTITDGGIQQ